LPGGLLTAHAASKGAWNLVVYWVAGGWDTSFVFDPHWDDESVEGDGTAEPGTAGGLSFADAPSRPAVRAFFDEFGAETVIANGMAVGSISHSMCTRLVMTGSRLRTAADLPTRVSSALAPTAAAPHLVLSGPRYPGELGAMQVPLTNVLTGTLSGTSPAGSDYDADAEERIRAYLELAASARPSSELGDVYQQGLSKFSTLAMHADALALEAENPTPADLLPVGITALSRGLSRCLVVEGSVPSMSTWDTHMDNDWMQDVNFENAFTELLALLELLRSTPGPSGGPLIDTTLVLALSEMGRTPVHNADAGKDHWPYTSAMLVGRMLDGGRVLGASNEALVGQDIDLATGAQSDTGELLTPAGLAAGVLQAFGVDPAEAFPDVTPFTAPFRS